MRRRWSSGNLIAAEYPKWGKLLTLSGAKTD
jgi:hypothetical protein